MIPDPGEATFGHYYLHQRSTLPIPSNSSDFNEQATETPASRPVWLKLNDSQVTEVSEQEVFKDTTGSTANPYWLAYVRKGTEWEGTMQRGKREIMAS
jgi:hypothetical protein